MSAMWNIEIHLDNLKCGSIKVIHQNFVDAAMVMALASMGARFRLDGVEYTGKPPIADLDRCVLVYRLEGYG
jgi:G:T-mismatch repair DNA endonuclease (very short patch repair protein)